MTTITTHRCPVWCREHLNADERTVDGAAPLHHGVVNVAGFAVEVERNDAPDPHGAGIGVSCVVPPEFTWMHAADARAFAGALLAAADLIDESRQALRCGIGASITAAMVEGGVTPARLADLIGMSEAYLWRRLAGAVSFSAEDVSRIAATLDVEVGVLLA